MDVTIYPFPYVIKKVRMYSMEDISSTLDLDIISGTGLGTLSCFHY
jgi:hypothetical protein